MASAIRSATVCVVTLMSLSTSLCFAASMNCSQPRALRVAISGATTKKPATIESLESLATAGERVLRSDAQRTMHHHDSAIQHALGVLGQAVNPVRVVSSEEIRAIYARAGILDPPAGLVAFRAPGDMNDPNIYVSKNSSVYRDAVRKPSALTVLRLAATLVHEQVHNTDREFAAYRLQSDFVRSKLSGISRHQQQDARHHLEELDARARAFARAERSNTH